MTDRIEWQEPQPDRMCRLVVTYDHTERDATPLDLERAGYVPTPQHSRVSDLERALADLAARTGERDTERRKTEAWKRTVDAAVNAAREWAVVGDGHNFRAMMADLLAATAFADDTRPASLPREGQERTCDDYDTEYVLDAMAAAAVNQPPAKGCEPERHCDTCKWYPPDHVECDACDGALSNWTAPAAKPAGCPTQCAECPSDGICETQAARLAAIEFPTVVEQVVSRDEPKPAAPKANAIIETYRSLDAEERALFDHMLARDKVDKPAAEPVVPGVWQPVIEAVRDIDRYGLCGDGCDAIVRAAMAAVRALDKGGAP